MIKGSDIISKILYNSENGEVIGEFDDDTVIKAYNPNNFNRVTIKRKLFFRLYREALELFDDEELKLPTLKIFFSLVKLLDFDKGEFVKINGMPANVKQISIYFKKTTKTLSKHIKILEKKELIKRIKQGRSKIILINPYVINYGKNQTEEALKQFSNTRWANPQKIRRIKKDGKNN